MYRERKRDRLGAKREGAVQASQALQQQWPTDYHLEMKRMLDIWEKAWMCLEMSSKWMTSIS